MDMTELVAGLGSPTGLARYRSYAALLASGTKALPAIRQGLRDPNWQVRRWSAMCLDQVADEEVLADLVPLLEDPHPKVRLWAVHSIACDHCKTDVSCPVDIVPLLATRVESDPDLRVRRMAVIMLGTEFRDPRAIPVLEAALYRESDPKILAHARRGLEYQRSGSPHS